MNQIIIVLFVIFSQTISKELPDYIHVCNRNDPNINSCIKESVISLRSHLIEGIPDLKVPPLEPLKLNKPLTLDTFGGSIKMNISIKNLKVHGGSNFKILDLNYNVKDVDLNFTLGLDHVFVSGDYNSEGRLLFIPIKATGQFLLNLTDNTGFSRMSGEIVKRNGEDYVNIKDIRLKINVGKGVVTMLGLFEKSTAIGGILDTVINENFDIIAPEFYPTSEKALESYFIDVVNKIFSTFTYNQLFTV